MSTNGKICVRCQVELRPKQNGVCAVEMASLGRAAAYEADLWACPVCGVEMLLGFGSQPTSEHYKPDFQRVLDGKTIYEFWQNQRDRAIARTRINCTRCADPTHLPSHNGSQFCESGSIASGGTISHCCCDFCF